MNRRSRCGGRAPKRRWRTCALLTCALLTAVSCLIGAPLAARTVTPVEVGHAELEIEVPRGGAFASEMLKLHVRSIIHGFVALEDLRQPDLVDLDWKQLGPDVWSYAMEKGLRVNAFERTMAIYPQRAGRIIVAPFVHHLTLVGTDGLRGENELRTNSIALDVRPLPKDAGEWWLPARRLSLTDTWNKRPDRLNLGETARRTVVIEAIGVGVERLPPAPKMRAPGVISFAVPTERSYHVTEEGPVARVTYGWDVRPVSSDAALLPAVDIAWYDTLARRSRVATIPERRISLASAELRDETTGQVVDARGFSATSFVLGAAAAFVWSLGAIALGRRLRRSADLQPALDRLRRAARRHDPLAFRAALPPLSAALAKVRDTGLTAELAALDRHIFGRPDVSAPPLVPLYRAVARAVRAQARTATTPHRSVRLMRIDG